MSKNLSKSISFLDYFDNYLIVLAIASGGVSIESFATVIGIPVILASASLSLAFLLCTGLVKKLIKSTRNKKKIKNIIRLLC